MKKKCTVNSFLEKRSFQGILVFSFVFVSIIPILVSQYFSYNRLSRNLQDNMNRLSAANNEQTETNLRITIDAYEDILYQLYTNDEAVRLIENIDGDVNLAVAMSKLRRLIHGMCYAKDGIEAITVITQGGNVIYYDKITASNVNSSWLGSGGLDAGGILSDVLGINTTKIYPTSYTSNTDYNPNYLFHMAHRMIDYKQIGKDVGAVVLSLNENILGNICKSEVSEGTFSFILGSEGRVISFPNKRLIGTVSPDFSADNISASCRALLTAEGYANDTAALYSLESAGGWHVITVSDQSAFYDEIERERRNMLAADFLILAVTAMLIISVTSLLARSMKKVRDAMRQAKEGDLSASVPAGSVFSLEMVTIVHTFNEMMLRIKDLVNEVKQATVKQKDAEIKALEAQANPHFLYNTLDSINWMAIDNEQFEISHMITSLAKILRYSINNSNAVVSLGEEIEWLRQYIYLQQFRSKNDFDYKFDIDETALDFEVHKLLFQPFVENSIKHGFKDSTRKNLLGVIVLNAGNAIRITIQDNGCGIDMNKPKGGDNIGMANAVSRIKMYYGDKADVKIDSQKDAGTTVTITLSRSE